MSLFTRFFGITGAQDLLPGRFDPTRSTGSVVVTADTAMRMSAVWACLRIRADLISTMPVDVFRDVGEQQINVPTPSKLVLPGGERVGIEEWMYSTSVDLDRAGNAIGLITERDSLGLPQRIDLQPLATCSVTERPNEGLRYRIDGKTYLPDQVWHEKQFTVSGSPVGMSAAAAAATTIGQYQSAQQFAAQWYGTGGVPKAIMRNISKPQITEAEADHAKRAMKLASEGRDVAVWGRDWEYKPIQSESVGMDWLEAQKFGIGDVARFFGVPGDLIDAAVSTGSITYANMTQRNLQFLIMNLGPAIRRRETALSSLLPRPRYVKLNTSSLLRMDDETRAKVINAKLFSRSLTITEARRLENRPPLTGADLAEFAAAYGDPKAAPTAIPTPGKGV